LAAPINEHFERGRCGGTLPQIIRTPARATGRWRAAHLGRRAYEQVVEGCALAEALLEFDSLGGLNFARISGAKDFGQGASGISEISVQSGVRFFCSNAGGADRRS